MSEPKKQKDFMEELGKAYADLKIPPIVIPEVEVEDIDDDYDDVWEDYDDADKRVAHFDKR